MKKAMTIGMGTFVVAMGLVSAGCADDRPVYTDGTAVDSDVGGSGGTSNTGNTGGYAGNDNTGGTGANNTGGSSGNANIPVTGLDNVFSFDIDQSDNYNEWSFWSNKRSQLKSCIGSTSCMAEAWYNTSGREFQFLTTGVYKEAFRGIMKGFCRVYQSTTCGSRFLDVAGDGCTDSNGYARSCVVSLSFGFSDSNGDTDGTATGNTVLVGAESGDDCQPYIACGGYEHSASIGRDGMTPLSGQVNNGTVIEAESYAEKVELEVEMSNLPAFDRPLVTVVSSAVGVHVDLKALPTSANTDRRVTFLD